MFSYITSKFDKSGFILYFTKLDNENVRLKVMEDSQHQLMHAYDEFSVCQNSASAIFKVSSCLTKSTNC